MSLGRFLARLSPSLLTRLIVALVLVGLVPMGFAVYRLIDINRAGMTDQVERTLALATRSKANEIASVLDTWRSMARVLSGYRALADPTSEEARELLVHHLEAMGEAGVRAIAFVNPRGERYIHAQVATDDAGRQAVQMALEPLGVGETLAFPTPGGPLIRVAAPLPAELGYVWLICDGSRIEGGLEADELATDAELALIDRSSLPIVGSTEGFPASMIGEATSGKLQGVRSRFEAADSVEFVGTYSPVAASDLTVLGRQPTSEAHRVARQMRRQALLAVALALLLVAGLAVGAYSSVIRPLRSLTEAQRELAGLGATDAKGNEIEQLRSSFESLRRGLRDREELNDVFLGRYRVIQVIGSGAMGTVFLARDPKLERDVALKTIRLDRQLEPEKRHDLVRRLLKEAVTGARFSHPNIVVVYDVEDRPEAAFLAMEYVDGMSLESLLWEAGRLPFEQVVPLGSAIARGLGAAHAHDLVHRDVKPANVLLGKDGSIKLTDFGISDLISALSQTPDVVFGTPGYLPPETIRGKGYHKSGDLFSLGALLYYCLTGSRPFDGATAKEVIRKTLAGNLTPLGELEPTVPPTLADLVMRLLASDLERRPSDANEVAELLRELAETHRLRWQVPKRFVARRAPEGGAGAGRFVPTVRVEASSARADR